MSSRVLVAGVGNLFLSDDGFGPEVVRRLVLSGEEPLPDAVQVVDYGIRGLHLAYDLLDGCEALVLVDAMPFPGGAPGEVRLVQVTEEDLGHGELDAHGMDPVTVLADLGTLGGTLPPTYVVGCHPASVDEGIGLSPAVEAAVPAAVAQLRRLLVDLVTRAPSASAVQPPPRATPARSVSSPAGRV